MSRFGSGWILGLVLLATTVGGCASGPITIPTGRWVGQGSYVDYEAVFDKQLTTVSNTKGKDGEYDTELTITRQKLFGHEALVFEILSRRGKLMNLEGDETCLTLALVELGELDHGNKLYALAGCHLGPVSGDIWEEADFQQGLQFARGVAMHAGTRTVLQVYYAMPEKNESVWMDVFSFNGDQLLKTGALIQLPKSDVAEPRLCNVYWAEELRKIR